MPFFAMCQAHLGRNVDIHTHSSLSKIRSCFFHSSNTRKATGLVRHVHRLVNMDNRLSLSSVEVDTSHSDHEEAELSDLDELCSIGGEESDVEKQAKPASSTKCQRQKKVPAKFRDSAFVTGSARAKFEAEMRDSKFMHGHKA